MQSAKCKIRENEMENIIENKSSEFAVRVVKLYQHLTENEFNSIEKDAKEIIAILTSICKKTNRS